MDNVLNYNGKVPEETLSGSNLDSVKTTLRGLFILYIYIYIFFENKYELMKRST